MNRKLHELSFERVVFFSDAVFAIVITLLILEIKPPHIEALQESAIVDGLLELLPKIIGFVTSFAIIGVMWIQHHQMFQYIEDFDGGLLWRNLLLLLFVSIIPFPTALFSEYPWSHTAFLLYAASFAAVALVKRSVWQYASRGSSLLTDNTDTMLVAQISRRSLAIPIACGLAGLLS